ncbi:glutamate--tRNA ligase [Candidatus Woesearchaeota archaeon]|jgi:glutamyl-tRNA synthetase|nr:glutamate--tRNA ligase [Candidatus Woesearchaeota archaeon]
MDDETKTTIKKFVLQNAVKFGSAQAGKIISKVLGEQPELRAQAKELMPIIKSIVEEVNLMSEDTRVETLKKIAPEMLEEKPKEERNMFAVLGINEGDCVKTAFPPGPEKYPHIGHAKACLLNYLIAQQYKGKFVLRFEDTNPKLVKSVFYEVLLDNLAWLGVKWDELFYASDHMDLFYELAEKVIKSNDAYMCFCNGDAIKESRMTGVACECRARSVEENMKLWKELPQYEEGKAILRLKIDLNHKNSTMKDPTIFRVLRIEHARHANKYTVWPNYDFQNAIMDGKFGVTHRVRSKEFEMRSELQTYIQNLLGLPNTTTYEFARFNMEGVLSSGRVIREQVDSGNLTGWDDPRLTTIVALRRRGFLPEAIKNFVVSTGMTKSESTLTWDDLILHNRRILDKTAKRYFFISDFNKVCVKDTPEKILELESHPEKPELGKRKLKITNNFIIPTKDLAKMNSEGIYRLMDCINFRKKENEYVFDSEDFESYKKNNGNGIFHFLGADDNNIDVEIFMNDATKLTGLAEPAVLDVKIGDVVQFERFGFCRLDSIDEVDGKKVFKFWFTHK